MRTVAFQNDGMAKNLVSSSQCSEHMMTWKKHTIRFVQGRGQAKTQENPFFFLHMFCFVLAAFVGAVAAIRIPERA